MITAYNSHPFLPQRHNGATKGPSHITSLDGDR